MATFRGSSVRYYDSENKKFVKIQGSQATGSDYTLQLPPSVGSADQVLKLPSSIGSTNQLVWADSGNSNNKSVGLLAGTAGKPGNAQTSPQNPRQVSFQSLFLGNQAPCLVVGQNNGIKVTGLSFKWNAVNAPTIAAGGVVSFKLGKLTDPNLIADVSEGTVNFTDLGGNQLDPLEITSADSGTFIYKTLSLTTPVEFQSGDVLVIVFTKPTVVWSGANAQNGDLDFSMEVEYT